MICLLFSDHTPVHERRKGSKASIDFEIWHFPITFQQIKVVFLASEFHKIEISSLLPLLKNTSLTTSGKIFYWPPPGKNPSNAHAYVFGPLWLALFSNLGNDALLTTTTAYCSSQENRMQKESFVNKTQSRNNWASSRLFDKTKKKLKKWQKMAQAALDWSSCTKTRPRFTNRLCRLKHRPQDQRGPASSKLCYV